MFKLIIIVVALVFALTGYRKAWYSNWAFLFNLLISVYIAIMSMPQLVDKFPVVRDYLGNFSYSASILLGVVVIFTIMQSFALRFFTAAYVVSFPKILNGIGAAALGFLTGSVIAGFLLFLISITPLSDKSAVKLAIQDGQTPKTINTIVLSSCNFVHNISLQPSPTAIDDQTDKILTDWRKSLPKADSNSPPKTIFPIRPRPDE